MTNTISPIDKSVFLSGSTDSTVKVFDIKAGKCIQTFKGMESDVNSVKFFPNGWSFAAGGEDGSIKLFDIRASGILGNYTDSSYRESVNTISFSLSGRLIFGSYDLINESRITIWDTVKEQKLFELTEHKDRTTCIAVSPNGFALASCSWDQLVKVYG
jgi:guanine nucleotide-binding protein G(I)/G(S)/G(T) subunit beta-1